MPHFFMTDVVSLAIAVLLGGVLTVFPGYALQHLFDLLDFRSLPGRERLANAALFGITLTPILLHLSYKAGGRRAMLAFLLALVLAGLVQVLRGRSWPSGLSAFTKVTILFWFIVGAALMLDAASGRNVYPSWIVVDQSFRSHVTASLATGTSLPPASMTFHPGHAVPLHYHYLLFILSSALVNLSFGFVPASIAVMSMTLWGGLAFLALVRLYIVYFLPNGTHTATRIGFGLLLISGLDILPVAAEMITRKACGLPPIGLSDVEWWNGSGMVFGWFDTAAWEPHHLGALSACLIGCLLLWLTYKDESACGWRHAVAAGLAFASAAGMSVYVTAIFVGFLLIVALELLLNAPNRSKGLIVAGVVALITATPYIRELTERTGQGGGGPTFNISIREFQPIAVLLSINNVRSPWAWNLSYLAALPLNYLLELGFFFIAAAWWIRDHRVRKQAFDFRDHLLIGLLAISLVVTFLFSSGTGTTNDLEWRGILPAQFVLLLLGVEFIRSWSRSTTEVSISDRRLRQVGIITIAVGLTTSLLGIVLYRGRVWFNDHNLSQKQEWLMDDHFAERYGDLRAAYLWISRNTSTGAIVQESPRFAIPALGQYSERAAAIYGSEKDSHSGGTRQEFEHVKALLTPLFSKASFGEAKGICRETGVDYVVVQDTDPIWTVAESYVRTEQPVFSRPRVKVFGCRE